MQLQIIYSEKDAEQAEMIQRDMAQAGMRTEYPIALVLLTTQAISDEGVRADVRKLQPDGVILAPVLLDAVTVPDYLGGFDTLDLTKKYDKSKLINFINRIDVTLEQRKKNRQLFYVVGGIVLVMFVISLVSIASGIVAFPVDEYATENAIRDSQIATIVAPQIEELRPRTTEDALNFESTLEAVRNDDLVPFIVGTATAIPQQLQATNEARQTQIIVTEAAQTEAASE